MTAISSGNVWKVRTLSEVCWGQRRPRSPSGGRDPLRVEDVVDPVGDDGVLHLVELGEETSRSYER